MPEKEDSNEGASSLVLYKTYEPPASPPSSQPFIFQQYTVRETVTPTKLGNISMKEVSFSMCSGGSRATSSAMNLSFSPSATPKRQQRSRYMPMLLHDPLSLLSPNDKSGPLEPPHNFKHRNRNINPSKKAKVDSDDDYQKKSKNRLKHLTNCSSRDQVKVSKELPWRYISIISLVPVLVFSILIGNIWPVDVENAVILDSLLDSAEQSLMSSNLEPLHNALNQQVFGQEDAILSLLNILDGFINKDMLKNQQMPVIFLSGSSGVGKSLISSIVTNYYPPPGKSKFVLWPMPTPEIVLKKFSESHLNLVVIDNINFNLITDAMNWIKKLFNEALWQNKPIIVMLVLKIQVTTERVDYIPENLRLKADTYLKKLQSSGFDSHNIHLNVLSQENVKDCIRMALKKRGVINGPSFEGHVNSVYEMVSSKLDGCKSVWNSSASLVF